MKKLTSIEVRALKVAMLEEGLSAADLARLCGVALGTFRNWISAGFPVVSARYQIEACLNYRRPIWSSLQELQQRQHCLQVFGFDPMLASMQQLRLLGPDIGADFSGCPSLEAMRREVFARGAVTQKPVKHEKS